jgi:hypothetical protein
VWTVVQFWLRGAIIGEGFSNLWAGGVTTAGPFLCLGVGDSNALKQKGTAI